MKEILTILIMAAAIFAAPTVKIHAQNTIQDEDTKYATDLLKPGTKAPDFSLKTPNGKTIRMSDFKGKYIVLDFWASWCPDCIKDLPNMKRMYDTYSKRGIVFLGISFDDKKENWTAALEKHGIEYTQISELKKWKETDISKAYNIKWIPSLYLIDPKGKVVIATVMSEKVEKELGKISPECE